jgi:hypothetical protein
MITFFKKLWGVVAWPTVFVIDYREGRERWGEIKETRPAKENPFSSVYFLTVYDIMWDDGEFEKGVPTHQFQWDGSMYVRNKP